MARKPDPKTVRPLDEKDLDAVHGGAAQERKPAEGDGKARRAGYEVHGFINTDDPTD